MLSGPYKFSVRRKWLADSILADILDRLVGIILGTSGVLLSYGSFFRVDKYRAVFPLVADRSACSPSWPVWITKTAQVSL